MESHRLSLIIPSRHPIEESEDDEGYGAGEDRSPLPRGMCLMPLTVPGVIHIEEETRTRLAFAIRIENLLDSEKKAFIRPRRLSEIRTLDKKIRATFPWIEIREELPVKLTFGLNRNKSVFEARKTKIEAYLQEVFCIPLLHEILAEFFLISIQLVQEISERIQEERNARGAVESKRAKSLFLKSPPLNIEDSRKIFASLTVRTKKRSPLPSSMTPSSTSASASDVDCGGLAGSGDETMGFGPHSPLPTPSQSSIKPKSFHVETLSELRRSSAPKIL
jgi:hypothetical protein